MQEFILIAWKGQSWLGAGVSRLVPPENSLERVNKHGTWGRLGAG